MILGHLQLLGAVCLLVFNGMILHRAIAVRVLKADGFLSEDSLFAHGLFLSFAINGVVGQYLAMIHAFRGIVLLLLFVIIVVVFHREARSILERSLSLPMSFARLFLGGRWHLALAWLLFLTLAVWVSLRIQLPALNSDVYAHHMPITESILDNGGFIYPIVPHSFFGNMPSFLEVLFAEGMAIHGNYDMPGAVHFGVFVSYLVFLVAFSSRGRALGLLLLCVMLIDPFLWNWAVSAMTDTARACFSAGAIILLLEYRRNGSAYHLFFASLLCGAALASKYLGLLTLFICGLILLSGLHLNRAYARKLALFLGGLVIVSGYWYLKNLLLHGNPIYPYVFGHPGLSDGQMAALAADQGSAFHPEYRSFVRDILSLDGWRDFPLAVREMFFASNIFYVIVCLMLVSVVARGGSHAFLAASSVVYFALWYFFVFHERRYGITAYLLFLSALYFCVLALFERISTSGTAFLIRERVSHLSRSAKWGIVAILILVVLGGGATLHARGSVKSLYGYDLEMIYESQMGLLEAYTGRDAYTRYVSSYYQYYELYSCIAQKKLRNVFNPLDMNAWWAIREIVPGEGSDGTFMPWNVMYGSADELEDFVERHAMQYFVHLAPQGIVDIQRIPEEHREKAQEFFRAMVPKAEMTCSDKKGNSVYRLDLSRTAPQETEE